MSKNFSVARVVPDFLSKAFQKEILGYCPALKITLEWIVYFQYWSGAIAQRTRTLLIYSLEGSTMHSYSLHLYHHAQTWPTLATIWVTMTMLEYLTSRAHFWNNRCWRHRRWIYSNKTNRREDRRSMCHQGKCRTIRKEHAERRDPKGTAIICQVATKSSPQVDPDLSKTDLCSRNR